MRLVSDPMDSGNKRVAIATNWNYPDYGGMLQALATQMAIKSIGFDPEVLDATALQGQINKRKLGYFARNVFDFSVVKEKSLIVASALKRRFPGDYSRGMMARRRAFDTFSENYFLRSRRFDSWDDLREATLDYECVVVGSDQLWLPSNIVGDYYTLSFVPDEVRKISYATSFGVPKIPNYLVKKTASFLNRFDKLAAREASGQAIVQELTGRSIPMVCDPTLLIAREDWEQIASDRDAKIGQYIFCYLMGDNPYQRQFIKKASLITGFPIVSLPHLDRYIANDKGFADVELYDVSPARFLSLIKNAEIVCTDSFHGTIFSCIFERKFFVFPRFLKNETLSTNTRIDSLLSKLHLETRFVHPGDEVEECLARPMDYRMLETSIHAFQSDSRSYLKNAIGDTH